MERIHTGVLLVGITILTLAVYPGNGIARVDVNIGISLPPLVISAPPEMVVIPETYVYFYPELREDLFFYHGYWYRPYEGRWYRSAGYNGPWVYIVPERVPYALHHLPPNYRAMSGYRHIPYRDLSRNWRTWERDKYWERHGWNREREREREHGVAPSFRNNGERGRERHDSGRNMERERR